MDVSQRRSKNGDLTYLVSLASGKPHRAWRKTRSGDHSRRDELAGRLFTAKPEHITIS